MACSGEPVVASKRNFTLVHSQPDYGPGENAVLLFPAGTSAFT